jgi:hypothetical protein
MSNNMLRVLICLKLITLVRIYSNFEEINALRVLICLKLITLVRIYSNFEEINALRF